MFSVTLWRLQLRKRLVIELIRPKLIILVGIPGSGKSTYAQSFEELGWVHLSSDLIRKELYGDESIQGDPNEVFSLMQKRAVDALNNGQSVIYDSTALTRKDRAGIIAACPKFAKIECKVIWAPIETCIERDAARERTVGKEVIDKMLKRFQFPFYDEGIDEIDVIRPQDYGTEEWIDYGLALKESMAISHDNPHHRLSIMDHSIAARNYTKKHGFSEDVFEAAAWHDCGKPYVKSFINKKGEVTDVAHYYQHQCASAWILCGLTRNVDILWLVSTHMSPFLNEKYYKNLPPFLKLMVDQLHEADLAAH